MTSADLTVHTWREHRNTLAVIAAGGILGALTRYGAQQLWAQPEGTVGWTVLAINVLGSALLGVLMALIETGRVRHRLVRPFLGVGVCGGFTTFSTSMVDTERLIETGRVAAAGGHMALTLLGSLAALGVAAELTRRATMSSSHSGTRA